MKKNHIFLSLIVATAVSLIVNFAYLLSIWVISDNDSVRENKPKPEVEVEGVIRLAVDGHGYIVCEEAAKGYDSVYIGSNQVRRYGLRDGMQFEGTAKPARRPGAHPVLGEIEELDGEDFDYSSLFKRPNDNLLASIQIGFYLLMAFVMCIVFTHNVQGRNNKRIQYFYRLVICIAVAVAAYMLAPIYDWHAGEIRLLVMNNNVYNPMVMLQCSFTLVVCALYGLTWKMLLHQSEISVEMERLKGEAMAARYEVLVGQINPHFLFNSLNSLSMLVREGNTDAALKYIDQLSYTFRYTIRPDGRNVVSLDEEMKFLDAYRHLLEMRYADKLFFDIRIDERMRDWMLPALSLQPLVENAVKHNSITSAHPLTITIRTEGENLVVSNPIVPKLTVEESTGIGLANLTDRWSMLVGAQVGIVNDGEVFCVTLPLIRK